MLFYILIVVFAGCTSVKHQRIQNERDIRREVYEDARRKEAVKRSRDFVSDDMLGKWRFLELVVEERGGSEDILKVKAARTARRLKGLTLRFWKSGDTAYNYQIENMMSKTHGTYTTRSAHREDKPKSGRIHFYPISGTQIPDLLFNFAKGTPQQVLLSDGEALSTILKIDIPRISMKEGQMDLTLDLGMVLAPDGWLHRGNIRCSFERIE
ncbi:hypothetical protein J4G07_01840 [Candidatus Poribacteria bacterium]|nr:hypothetical protein [Candidatus Poribacteria bacterium]